MDELKRIYDTLFDDLKELHERWVKSNWKMRALEQAKMQLHSIGDIDMTPVLEMVNKEYANEKGLNESLHAQQVIQEKMLCKIKRLAPNGDEFASTREIFG